MKFMNRLARIAAVIALAGAVIGCSLPVKEVIVIEKQYIPVVLGDEHFAVPVVPAPPSRSETKNMTPRQYIVAQDDYNGQLHEHIGVLEKTIEGIKSAMNDMAAKLKKDTKQ